MGMVILELLPLAIGVGSTVVRKSTMISCWLGILVRLVASNVQPCSLFDGYYYFIICHPTIADEPINILLNFTMLMLLIHTYSIHPA